jgi:hypothetical protein
MTEVGETAKRSGAGEREAGRQARSIERGS